MVSSNTRVGMYSLLVWAKRLDPEALEHTDE